jgi:hypothetical protein
MSFWSKAKKAAGQAAPIAIPLLATTPAAYIAIKAIQKANAAKAAQKQQAVQEQKVARLDATPAKKDEDDEELMSMATSGIGDAESLFRIIQPFVSAAPGSVSNALAVKREKALARQEAARKRLEEEAAMADVNERDVAGMEDMGAPEIAALRRFAGNPVAPMRPAVNEASIDGGYIPNTVYRAAIIAQAKQLARGGVPSTPHFAAAQGIVNRSMARRGLRIAIPGAAPGRRTL